MSLNIDIERRVGAFHLRVPCPPPADRWPFWGRPAAERA